MYKSLLATSKRRFLQRAKGPYNVNDSSRTPTPTTPSVSVCPQLQTPPAPIDLNTPSTSTQQNEEIESDICDTNYLSDWSDEDEIDDNYDDAEKYKDFLMTWTHQYGIQKNAVSDLLKFLKANGCNFLPADSRTLLHTPTRREIVRLPPGEYCHIGLVKAIDYYLMNCKVVPKDITLDFNIDGVPLSHSSKNSFWLILVQVFGSPYNRKIFVVGVFNGTNKPENFVDFLAPTIEEANKLDEYQFNCKRVNIKIRCVICDAPARNSVLGTKSYNDYHGCEICTQEGAYINHRMTFPDIIFDKRTDTSFRNQNQIEHHNSDSAFLALNIDMIANFPLDYLHTVCIGVVKKMLHMWLKGDFKARLQGSDVERISSRLNAVAKSQPSDFQRKCRPLNEYSYYKGTELRTMIVYVLPVVTKGILTGDKYQHLLLLHVAIVILVDPQLCKTQADLAHCLLEHFVRNFSNIYGSQHIVYNVHSLLHMVDDVKLYGNLDEYSAFPFESYMSKIKSMLRRPNGSLLLGMNLNEEKADNFILKKKEKQDGYDIYREIVVRTFVLNNTLRNKWFQTVDKHIYQFEYCIQIGDLKTIYARRVVRMISLFKVPIDSDKLGIFESDGRLSELMPIDVINVQCKVFGIPIDENIVFAPLRHCALI